MGCQYQILAKHLCMNSDYIKQKFGDKAKLCYMDNDSFVIDIKTENFMKTLQMVLIDGYFIHFYTHQNKISPNKGTLLNGVLIPKLLISPFTS